MPKCEHFIYTSAKTASKKGYQVIAKSSEVTNEILSNLEGYLYPLGVKLNEFKTDSRFIIVDNEELIFMTSDKELDPQYDMGVWVKRKFFVDALDTMFEDSLK